LLPLFPTSLPDASGSLSLIAIAGVAYGALLAWTQGDLKKLAIWSGMSHQNLCLGGLLSLNLVGVSGGLLQAFGQALCAGALLFLIDGFHWEPGRLATRPSSFGPRATFCLIFLALAIAGAPGLCGFAGAALTLLGILRGHPAVGTGTGFMFCALLSWLLLCAAWLGAVSRIRDRAPRTHRGAAAPMTDLTTGELFALLPALALIVAIGVWPNFFLERTQPTVSRMLSAYGTAFTEQVDESSAKAGGRLGPALEVDRHTAHERE
jgi:NADH-quinone oxidoreductase subunit M